MASEVSTIQSLKAVDAWIDVINANINGGVRTAFKSSRLKFSGSNVDIQRAGGANALPLQMPEAGLTTANTVIDFTQGAITASTENTHLAIQGEGFFLLASPDIIAANGQTTPSSAGTRLLLTRDGEFRTNQNGLVVHAATGYLLVTSMFFAGTTTLEQTNVNFGGLSAMRAVYNDMDTSTPATTATSAIRLSTFVSQSVTGATTLADGVTTLGSQTGRVPNYLIKTPLGKQSLQYSTFGSTVFDFGYNYLTGNARSTITLGASTTSDATILSKSLEASNASMTQSVPELSLAQKLFSALTKVLQTKQTNVDGVLNLVR